MFRPPALLTALVLLAACASNPAPPPVPPAPPSALADSIDAAVARVPGAVVAVAVRRATPSDSFALDRDADRDVHAASTMKVPVMIEAFRQVARGERAWDDPVRVENRFRSIVDGSEYAITDDTDDALYTLRGETVSFRDLTERAITTSSNLATNLLIQEVSADTVQATVERLGAPGMRVLRGVEDLKAFEAGLSNRTTARALATLLEALRDGRAVSPEADAEMVEILAAQRFNEMIPAGLPPGTRVAHKTGWITEIHHDAAIVYPDGAPYVLVILTEGIADREVSSRLGAEITAAVHAALEAE